MKKITEKKKLHVKKGDMVEVISGKSKGQTGKIVEVSNKFQSGFFPTMCDAGAWPFYDDLK